METVQGKDVDNVEDYNNRISNVNYLTALFYFQRLAVTLKRHSATVHVSTASVSKNTAYYIAYETNYSDRLNDGKVFIGSSAPRGTASQGGKDSCVTDADAVTHELFAIPNLLVCKYELHLKIFFNFWHYQYIRPTCGTFTQNNGK